jgi:putative oxidoreductase
MRALMQLFLRRGGGTAPPATVLIRLAVGGVFLTSGAIKFLYANQGVGRFVRLGIPAPEVMANFVGGVEIVAGALLIVGLFTRLAALPLIIDMAVAIVTGKVPLLFGPGPEPVAAPPQMGLWAFAYQARLDFTMLLACVFLLVAGAGVWSLDAWGRRGGCRARGSGGKLSDSARGATVRT